MSKRGGKRQGAGRPEGARSIAPVIREAFLKAVDELEAEGTPLSELLKHHLKDNLLNTLRAISPYNPREKNIEFESDEVSYVDILIAAQPKIDKEREIKNKK